MSPYLNVVHGLELIVLSSHDRDAAVDQAGIDGSTAPISENHRTRSSRHVPKRGRSGGSEEQHHQHRPRESKAQCKIAAAKGEWQDVEDNDMMTGVATIVEHTRVGQIGPQYLFVLMVQQQET